jgi:hypothetical protein
VPPRRQVLAVKLRTCDQCPLAPSAPGVRVRLTSTLGIRRQQEEKAPSRGFQLRCRSPGWSRTPMGGNRFKIRSAASPRASPRPITPGDRLFGPGPVFPLEPEVSLALPELHWTGASEVGGTGDWEVSVDLRDSGTWPNKLLISPLISRRRPAARPFQ